VEALISKVKGWSRSGEGEYPAKYALTRPDEPEMEIA